MELVACDEAATGTAPIVQLMTPTVDTAKAKANKAEAVMRAFISGFSPKDLAPETSSSWCDAYPRRILCGAIGESRASC
jgi:hypothetical protein